MILGYWYKLYMNMTESEKALEPAIAALGELYRVQHPFLKFKHFADFALPNRKLVIEVDGDSHLKPLQKKKDLDHMIGLKSIGWDVVRVTNEQSQADPAGTVAAALIARRTTLEELQEALAQLLLDYPELLVPPAKKSRRKKRRPPRKGKALGLAVVARNKRVSRSRAAQPRPRK